MNYRREKNGDVVLSGITEGEHEIVDAIVTAVADYRNILEKCREDTEQGLTPTKRRLTLGSFIFTEIGLVLRKNI